MPGCTGTFCAPLVPISTRRAQGATTVPEYAEPDWECDRQPACRWTTNRVLYGKG